MFTCFLVYLSTAYPQIFHWNSDRIHTLFIHKLQVTSCELFTRFQQSFNIKLSPFKLTRNT